MRIIITERQLQEIESKWNDGGYDYQHGYCHYFAYNIIGKLRKLYPNKKINYYIIIADVIYDFDEGELESRNLVHVYIKIDDVFLDSNGISDLTEVERRTKEFYDNNIEELESDYRLDVYHKEFKTIPKQFLNKNYCDSNTVKKDIKKFLSHPEIKELLKIFDSPPNEINNDE